MKYMSIIGEYHEEIESRLQKVIELQDEYIKFLAEEIASEAMFLHIHHVDASEEVVEKDKTLRKLIKEAKELCLKG